MRADIGGPPESRNNVRMMQVTTLATVEPVAVNTPDSLIVVFACAPPACAGALPPEAPRRLEFRAALRGCSALLAGVSAARPGAPSTFVGRELLPRVDRSQSGSFCVK